MKKVAASFYYTIGITLKIAYIIGIVFTLIAIIGTLFINKVDMPAVYLFAAITIGLRIIKSRFNNTKYSHLKYF